MNNARKVVVAMLLMLSIGTVLASTHHHSAPVSPYVSALSPTAVMNAAACDPFPRLKCVNLSSWAAGCMSTALPDTCVEVHGPVSKCQNEICGD